MDTVNTYRVEIKRILSAYAALVARQPKTGVETLLVEDEARDEYLWLQVGRADDHRVYDVTLHVHIVEGKIRIEQDWTEEGIASDLLQAGVPRRDIVLAFHEPVAEHTAEIVAG